MLERFRLAESEDDTSLLLSFMPFLTPDFSLGDSVTYFISKELGAPIFCRFCMSLENPKTYFIDWPFPILFFGDFPLLKY